MSLTDQLEEMRLRFLSATGSEEEAIRRLGAELAQCDARLILGLDQIIAGHEQSRSAIVERIEALASRIGLLPRAAPAAEPPRLPPIEERFMPPRLNGHSYKPGDEFVEAQFAGGSGYPFN